MTPRPDPDDDATRPANEAERRVGPETIDQRQQQIDPTGEHRQDVNANATTSMKQPGNSGTLDRSPASAAVEASSKDFARGQRPSDSSPPLAEKSQSLPGTIAKTTPKPDHGEVT